MKLKVYADRLSQPSRAVIIFCKVNGIDFEEIEVKLANREQHSPEFKDINPMAKVPAIVDGRLKLFESHAILTYLSCAFPGVADHWYPNDLLKRAKIHSVLDWHHSNLRLGTVKYVFNHKLAPVVGLPLNPKAAAKVKKILSSSLSKIDSFWLKGSGRFLVGSNQPSIADLSLVCETMQLELLDEEDRIGLMGPHKKVQQWIESTKNATSHTLMRCTKSSSKSKRICKSSNHWELAADLHLALTQHCIKKWEKFFSEECCMICKPFLFFEEAWFKASVVEAA